MEPNFNNAEYIAHVSGLVGKTTDPDVREALENYATFLGRISTCLAHQQMFIPTDAMRSIIVHGRETSFDRSLTYDDYILSAKFYRESFI